jgi:hypothetical protein
VADVTWDLDDDGEFDDAFGANPTVSFASAATLMIRARIVVNGQATISEPAAVEVGERPPQPDLVAPGAANEVTPLPVPTDLEVTIPAGETTDITLTPTGTGSRFMVVSEPTIADVLIQSVLGDQSAVSDGDSTRVETGSDGRLRLTPGVGVVGTGTFEVALVEAPDVTATVTVHVTGNRPPVLGDDVITVELGVESTFPASDLLANDSDPDAAVSPLEVARLGPASDLRVVSVFGTTNGEMWLDVDGRIHVIADTPGAGSATYVVTDGGGGTYPGTIRLIVTQQVPPVTTGPTTTSTTSPTTVAVTTPTPVPVAPTAPPGPAGPAGPGNPQVPSGGLPATGSDLRSMLFPALLTTLFGLLFALCAGWSRRWPREGNARSCETTQSGPST